MKKAGWCNENASTINLKSDEIFTKGLPKNLKDFANKRQVKHTSSVLEPSIPFHTLVKLIDAEGIANDKTRTHELQLELNNITNPLQTQTLDSSQQEQLMFTPSRDPNNKNEPAYKKYIVPIVIEQTILSFLVSKNNEMMKIKVMPIPDRNLLKSQLYSNFVFPQTTEQKDMMHAIEVVVLYGLIFITKIQTHKTDIDLHPKIYLVMTKILLLHNTLDHDRTSINEIHDPIALLTDLLTDPHIGMTLVLDIDHVHVQEIITILQDTHLLIDQLQDLEILDTLDHVHIPIQEINLRQYNHNTKMTQLTLKCTCIIQLKWQML